MQSNPYNLSKNIESTLKRYIPTTLNISRNYPLLRSKFYEILDNQEIVKGPYVEALPDFEKGSSLRGLLKNSGGYLHDGFENFPDELLDRKLHRHQHEALELACQFNQSLLIATGTGSGKTETFLYPIANMLLSEDNPDQPGVRALIIYPMNALANDQLFYRIAPMFGNWLGEFNLTFGRYTSQIRANAKFEEEISVLEDNERLMNALDGKVPKSWLITREQMLSSPPKILLTNYAMLEHLLLLPRNAPLFHFPTLKCIVLDEIHTYTGAQATEVAFLLRKLKNRLNLSEPLQVFGTSASLSNEPGADKKLINFASTLFGEKVQSVIRGQRKPHSDLIKKDIEPWSITSEKWIRISELLNIFTKIDDDYEGVIESWNREVVNLHLKNLIIKSNEHYGSALFRFFKSNSELRKCAKILSDRSVVHFYDLAGQVFPETESHIRIQALNSVIHAGMLARSSPDSFPLLPARYHIAANGIEGMCISLKPNSEERWDDMKPFRNGYGEDGRPYYPLLVCRRCGQPFLEGYFLGGHLFPSSLNKLSGSKRKVFWLGKPVSGTLDENDEDVEIDLKKKPGKNKKQSTNDSSEIILNIITGQICSKEDVNAILLHEVNTHSDEEERKVYVKSCPACGAKASGGQPEVVTSMHPGDEAMAAVVCHQVLNFLPADVDKSSMLPLGGRNLLTFSDNRQDAAFFAPYFERTSNDLALRSATFQILRDEPDEAYNFCELADEIIKRWRKEAAPVIIDGTGKVLKKKSKQNEVLTGHLAAEFCTPGGRRTSLESFGVVKVVYDSKSFTMFSNQLSQAMPRLNEYASSMASILLEHVRREKAISAPADGVVDMTDGSIWGEHYAMHRSFELQKSQNSKATHTWIPAPGSKRHNRRTWFLIEKLGWNWDEARLFLDSAWKAMKISKLLVPLKPGYGLDEKKIKIVFNKSLKAFRCNKCGLLFFHHIKNLCHAFRCSGDLTPVNEEEMKTIMKESHYLYLFDMCGLETLRAREHTAVLSQDIRIDIEREFADRELNLLSCTTTMEMGVDLGDLEAIACLNIPPGISNYQQRTGRAGRRAQAAPFCVTIAKGGRYDQSVFRDFDQYLKVPSPTSTIYLSNPQLFQRHQFSILLSGFLKYRINNSSINAPTLRDFFGEKFNREAYSSFMECLLYWMEGSEGKGYLEEAHRLISLLPDKDQQVVGLSSFELRNAFTDRLEKFSLTILERCMTYYSKRDEYAKAEKYDKASSWQKQADRFMRQFLVNKLAYNGLIPTYSFPVHSLTLEVNREQKSSWGYNSSDIALNRDAALGISEYAPGSRVVANGRVWSSAGLTYSPRQFMPERFFKSCPECNHVEIKEEKDDLSSECPFCGYEKRGLSQVFIEPYGFTTDYKEREGLNPAHYRPRKIFADEARLITQARDQDFQSSGHHGIKKALMPSIGTDDVEPGLLFVVNRGPYGSGFHRCHLCNRMEPAKKKQTLPKKHDDIRTGITCLSKNMSFPVCLAHTFTTDIIIFRFIDALSNDQDRSDQDNYNIDSMAITLSEAMRFAAIEILNIQDSELKATFKIRGNKADVILYDSIPGGAGYSSKLMDLPVKDLLSQTISKLKCPSGCETACRSCLCDYSNQLRWDAFKRKPVLKWLEKISKNKANLPVNNAVPWEKYSIEGLSRRLVGFNELHLAGKSLLSDNTVVNGDSLNWLKSQLDAQKKIFCHLTQSVPYKPKELSANQRLCWNYLRPYIQGGHLVITQIKKMISPLPRVFPSPVEGAPAFYSGYSEASLLDNIVPHPVYSVAMSKDQVMQLSNFINQAQVHPETITDSASPEIMKLSEGESREVNFIFKSLCKAHLENFVIEDPYCGLKVNRPKLLKLIGEISQLSENLEKISIVTREPHYKDYNWESRGMIQSILHKEVSSLGFPEDKISIKVMDYKFGRKMHDRTLRAKVLTVDGSSQTHIYDLSGGVDYLMDQSRSTKVYHYLRD